TAQEEGVTVWRYAAAPRGAGPIGRFRAHLAGAAGALRAAARRIGRPFVLNGHGHLPYYAALRCREVDITRRIMTVHSPPAVESRANCGGSRGPVQAVMHAVFRAVERRCYERSDGLQCFSRFIAGRLADTFPRLPQVAICPAYVDCGAMAVDASR